MKLVVIESPFAGDVERNIKYTRRCMADSLSRGEAPYASHLLYTQDGILDDTIQQERIKGMQAGFAWGKCADTVAVYVDFGISEGMEAGISAAHERGARIEYRAIGK